jgi:hypothetical protein
METRALDSLPGFRRRLIVTPGPGAVRSALEDDYHCMSVTLRHAGGIATAVEPVMDRAPWTTCPGAVERLVRTFTGVALDAFAKRGEKTANCTHLHDLALLAAAHAQDDLPLVYDILVSDPDDGRRRAELRRDGAAVMGWTLEKWQITEPPALAGLALDRLRPWIDSLEPAQQEAARLLRWGTVLADGRIIPMERQSDASRMPAGNCYTFQPNMVGSAKRVGKIRDFSKGAAHPLDGQSAAPAVAGEIK